MTFLVKVGSRYSLIFKYYLNYQTVTQSDISPTIRSITPALILID